LYLVWKHYFDPQPLFAAMSTNGGRSWSNKQAFVGTEGNIPAIAVLNGQALLSWVANGRIYVRIGVSGDTFDLDSSFSASLFFA
jgi:hypothetical protein